MQISRCEQIYNINKGQVMKHNIKMIKLLSTLTVLLCTVLINNPCVARETFTVTGTVMDVENKTSISRVNISIQNSPHGTTTDQDGNFRLEFPTSHKPRIIFSHIGYVKKEIVVDQSLSQKPLNIFMTSKVIKMHNVVVSAALYEQPLNKLSKPATVITRRQISDQMQSNMTDMLAATPGFTQVWEYHSPLLLRGMNSKRLVVMQNGNRRIGTFPGGYFAQDMNIYDAQKVEIIKGPGSVIYGSGAISGIINVINKPPLGPKRTTAKSLSGYGSNNNEFLQVVRVCQQNPKFGISLNGKYRKTGDLVYGNGEDAENSDVEDKDMSLTTGYSFSEKQKVTLEVNGHQGDWGKPRGFNGPSKAYTEIRNEEERLHSAINYAWTLDGFVQTVQFNLYYDQGTRDYYKYKYSTVSNNLSSLELVHYDDKYGGGQLFTIFNLYQANKLTAGIDGYAFQLDNPSEMIDYYYNTTGDLPGYIDAGQMNIGAFVSDEWQLGPRFRLISGVRYDAATVNEGEYIDKTERKEERNAVSGNAGFVYSQTANMHWSVNLGRAFRMPTAEEMFTEVISCKGTKLGNPDLQPEYSWNLDVGLRGMANREKLRYDFALFYNDMDDYINEMPADDIPDVDFTYKNTDATIYGGEFSLAYRFEHVYTPLSDLYIGLGGAYVYGIDKAAEKDDAPLFGIPPLKLTGELKYHGLLNCNWMTGYTIKLQAEYAAKQDRIADIPKGSDGGPWGYEPSDEHLLFNCMLALNSNSLPGCPKLRIVVKNIFDLDYLPYGSYIPAMGRNVKTVLSFDI